jgi:hypothetical protein
VRYRPEVFPALQAATGDRAGQVGHALLTGLGVVVGLAAFAVLAYWCGRAFGWMVNKRWPVMLYAAAAVAVIIGGYIANSVLMYYAIGALILPVLLLMFLALIGF